MGRWIVGQYHAKLSISPSFGSNSARDLRAVFTPVSLDNPFTNLSDQIKLGMHELKSAQRILHLFLARGLQADVPPRHFLNQWVRLSPWQGYEAYLCRRCAPLVCQLLLSGWLGSYPAGEGSRFAAAS